MDIVNKIKDILPNKEKDANNGMNDTKLLIKAAKGLAAGLAVVSPFPFLV